MRKLALLFAVVLAFSAAAETIVFRDVTVVPMSGITGPAKQNVVVTDGKIVSVSPVKPKVAEGTTVIDGAGKWLIPGLAEMHGHIPPPNAPADVIEDTLFLYVANGITTVRGMLGHPGQLELREKAKRGEIVAPNLYLAGPSFNGNSVNSPEEAMAKVRAQKAEGWDLLKVHPGLTRAEYDAMAKTAKEEGMRFGGHVPEEVGLLHAIEMGQETFDHIDGYAEYLEAEKGPLDAKKLADVVKRSKQAGVWIVPTSALWEVLYGTVPLETLKAYPELKYVPQASVDQWSTAYAARLKETPREEAKNVIAARVKILDALHEAGVKILMGTDAPQQFSVPGFSLHRELLRMRASNMTPYEILKTGTKNVGEYFAKQDSFGTIEPGKRADLVLLDADPLKDVANVSKIAGVMVRGRWLSREALDARLEAIEEKYKR
ncbi:MAG TPA: amidohydrolase family protein [Thermoanaerobaculia bacterium]|jgi:imidazolonepropionase-like amidohydrolase